MTENKSGDDIVFPFYFWVAGFLFTVGVAIDTIRGGNIEWYLLPFLFVFLFIAWPLFLGAHY